MVSGNVPNCAEKKLVINPVKQRMDVELDHPVVVPVSTSYQLDCVQG